MAGIMTGLAIAGAAAQLGGAGMSFANAAKQKKKQKEAAAVADKYMAEARQRLEVNYFENLAIQKEPYELERDANLVAGAQATEALRESDRGMGRIGAIYGQQQQGQRNTAAAMGQEMFNLDYLVEQENSRLRDLNTQLDLGEVSGAQLEAANAEERRAQQLQAGFQGVSGAISTGLEAVPLYMKTGAKTPSTAPAIGTEMNGLTPPPQQPSIWDTQQQTQIQNPFDYGIYGDVMQSPFSQGTRLYNPYANLFGNNGNYAGVR